MWDVAVLGIPDTGRAWASAGDRVLTLCVASGWAGTVLGRETSLAAGMGVRAMAGNVLRKDVLESSQVPVQGRHMSYREELDPVPCPKEVEGGAAGRPGLEAGQGFWE